MDHAINDLVERAKATIDIHSDLPREEVEPEIKAYVKAINVLEKYYYLNEEYYEENKTTLESFF